MGLWRLGRLILVALLAVASYQLTATPAGGTPHTTRLTILPPRTNRRP